MSELVVGSIAGLASNSYVVDVASGSTLDLSNGAVFPAGNVIQVASASRTTTFTTTSTSYVDLTDITVSITPKNTLSKFYIALNLATTSNSSGGSLNDFQIVRDATALGVTGRWQAWTGNATGNAHLEVFDSPSTESSITYKAQVKVSSGTGTFLKTNFVVMEIAG